MKRFISFAAFLMLSCALNAQGNTTPIEPIIPDTCKKIPVPLVMKTVASGWQYHERRSDLICEIRGTLNKRTCGGTLVQNSEGKFRVTASRLGEARPRYEANYATFQEAVSGTENSQFQQTIQNCFDRE